MLWMLHGICISSLRFNFSDKIENLTNLDFLQPNHSARRSASKKSEYHSTRKLPNTSKYSRRSKECTVLKFYTSKIMNTLVHCIKSNQAGLLGSLMAFESPVGTTVSPTVPIGDETMTGPTSSADATSSKLICLVQKKPC